MANDIFSSDNVGTPVDLTLNDLVGEGKKYKDPDELARAYAHIESHTKTVESENAEIRARLDSIEATNHNPNNPNPDGQGEPRKDDNPPANPPKAPDDKGKDVDFRSQIRDEVRALNEEERAVANIETAAARMVEVYGDSEKANQAVINRAKELGVSVEWLKDSASRSPSAFYASMGIQSGHSSSTPASGQGVRPPSDGSNLRNFEHYDKIRKENPKLYFTAALQTEMMREARTQGSDFYKR